MKRLLIWRNQLILAILAAVVLVTEPVSERYGDRFQYALPLLGFACAAATGGGVEYAVRFGLLEIAVQGSKSALGDAPVNRRPNGGTRGFPSGHTAAATFGASALVNDCITNSPATKAVVIIAAGFTGASRMDAGAHDIWQVLAGVLTGWGTERLLRRDGPLRRRLIAPFRTAGRRLRRLFGG